VPSLQKKPNAFAAGTIAAMLAAMTNTRNCVVAVLKMLPVTVNKGAAFSFLSDAGGWQRVLFTGLSTMVSIFLFFWLKQISKDDAQKTNQLLQVAITLILGGAIGNLIDRALTGEVVDFIQVYYSSYYFPAFNIADSAITLGASLLILDMLLETRRNKTVKN
jgi:signal peptidase II